MKLVIAIPHRFALWDAPPWFSERLRREFPELEVAHLDNYSTLEREIADADIEPAPSFGAKLRTDFINGMGKLGEKFVILLDIGKVLSVEELSLLAAAGEGPAALPGAQSARLEAPSAQGARLAAPGTGGAVAP